MNAGKKYNKNRALYTFFYASRRLYTAAKNNSFNLITLKGDISLRPLFIPGQKQLHI